MTPMIVEHPLLQHKLSILRNKQTGTKEFRDLVGEIATLLCYEATRDLPLEEVEIETPITMAKTKVLAGRKLALVPILRAGMGMLDGMLTLLPAAVFFFALPRTLFDEPFSATVWSRDGRLLSAKVAPDGQWRFFPTDSVPGKFRTAITTYEDKRFYRHFGVDPLALGRAVGQNLAAGRITSGASTLTMQTIRLSRGGKPRTFREKFVEMVLATRLELRCSKDEILALYASHAPFGGNVVGLESAAWYYFGRSARDLSWAESACSPCCPTRLR